MLSWLCNRVDMKSLRFENYGLDSWWDEHQRHYKLKLRREAEEQEQQRKIKVALGKLTTEEKLLLKINREYL